MYFFLYLATAIFKSLDTGAAPFIAIEKYFANKTGKASVFTFFFVSLH